MAERAKTYTEEFKAQAVKLAQEVGNKRANGPGEVLNCGYSRLHSRHRGHRRCDAPPACNLLAKGAFLRSEQNTVQKIGNNILWQD